MANSLPLLSSWFILILASNVLAIKGTSSVAKDLVPCTMCAECENPCQPLPPPPPPTVVECPPPPLPSPPPPLVIECPPPPKSTPCPDNCEVPQGPVVPGPPYPPVLYFPPGTPYPTYVPDNSGGLKMKPYSVYFTNSFICLCLTHYLFDQ